jgi:hypothetical protein
VHISYTLADIEQKTGAPVNRLRYVIDSGILPGWRNQKGPKNRGVARTFGGWEAFAIALTVYLLDAGVTRRTVERCLDLMTEYADGTRRIPTMMLYQAYSQKHIVGLEIGDRQNVRLVTADDITGRKHPWIQVETRAELTKYDPQVTIRINLTRLKERLPAS